MASVLPPMVAVLLTQVLVVFVLMFSPLNFPAERLPGLAAGRPLGAADPGDGRGHPGHGRLEHVPDDAWAPGRSWSAWCVGGLGIAYVTLTRRD